MGLLGGVSSAMSMELDNNAKAEQIYETFKKQKSANKKTVLVTDIMKLCKGESSKDIENILEGLLEKMIFAYKNPSSYSRVKSLAGGESDNLKFAKFLVAFGNEMDFKYKNLKGNNNDFKDYQITDNPELQKEIAREANKCKRNRY